MFATLVIGAVLAVIYFVYYYQDKRVQALINKIPGPETLPLLGNAHQLRTGHGWYVQALNYAEQFKQHRIFRIWLANTPVVAIYKPEHLEVVLSSMKHIDKSWVYDFTHPWLGTGLLTSTGEKWKQRRKMLTPTFHFNILHDFIEVFNKQSRILVKKLHGKAPNGTFNIFQDIACCALDIIAETAMGTNIDSQSTDSEYVHAVYRMSALIDQRMRKPWYWSDFLYNNIGHGKEYKEKLAILHNFTNKVIMERLNNFDQVKAELVGQELKGENIGSKSKVRMAFLDMLLYMSDNMTKLSMEDIREEVDTFMFEGHDTTAAAMNWAIHLIGANPEVQAQVHEEMDRVFGSDDRDATMEDLKELKYLECCIKEALRLFPSVPMFARDIHEDLELGEFVVPKDTSVVIMTTALHRNADVYPDPEAFKPERFFIDNSKSRHPYSYIPFSAGPRNCIGQKFAMFEEKTVLSHVFRNFSIKSKQERKDLRPVGDLILRPENGILVELTPRKQV